MAGTHPNRGKSTFQSSFEKEKKNLGHLKKNSAKKMHI
jgi:hypothetical protein